MLNEERIQLIEAALGHQFRDGDLLRLALTHRTWVEERYPGGNAPDHLSNQRLEFLGDAFLDYLVGHWLYMELPMAAEGHLTGVRAELVDQNALIRYADKLGLHHDDLLLGRGESLNASTNRRLLADAVEAIIGALLLDGGEQAAGDFIRSLLPTELPIPAPVGDPISVLNEYCQKMYEGQHPVYDSDSEGPDHALTWCCTVELSGFYAHGSGASKQKARRAAGRQMLALLGVPGWSDGGDEGMNSGVAPQELRA